MEFQRYSMDALFEIANCIQRFYEHHAVLWIKSFDFLHHFENKYRSKRGSEIARRL